MLRSILAFGQHTKTYVKWYMSEKHFPSPYLKKKWCTETESSWNTTKLKMKHNPGRWENRQTRLCWNHKIYWIRWVNFVVATTSYLSLLSPSWFIRRFQFNCTTCTDWPNSLFSSTAIVVRRVVCTANKRCEQTIRYTVAASRTATAMQPM